MVIPFYGQPSAISECIEGDILYQNSDGSTSHHVNGTVCSIQCPLQCMCGLGNFSKILMNCTSSNVTHTRVPYPANVTKLSLANNNLYDIGMESFSELTDTLKVLNLNNNSLTYLQSGVFKQLINLDILDLSHNLLKVVQPGVFRGLTSLTSLFLSNNMLMEIESGVFDGLKSLEIMQLVSLRGLVDIKTLYWSPPWNELTELHLNSTFDDIRNLTHLNLTHNPLAPLHPDIFKNLVKLKDLALSDTLLRVLPFGIFDTLSLLQHLDLSDNLLYSIQLVLFKNCPILLFIDLRGNFFVQIKSNSLDGLNAMARVFFNSYTPCCFLKDSQCLSTGARDPFLTCERLLPSNILRVGVWVISIFAITANLLGIIAQCMRRRPASIQLLLITNLSISDFLMGVYLIFLILSDSKFGDDFPYHSVTWRINSPCDTIGALSVLSSEASVFFITMISIDRFIQVKYPTSRYRLSKKSACFVVSLVWLIAILISFASLVLTKFVFEIQLNLYFLSEVCVGLPFTAASRYTLVNTSVKLASEKSVVVEQYLKTGEAEPAMFFSFFLFVGVNLTCFLVVGFCYASIFKHVRQSARRVGRAVVSNNEIRMAKKLFLLVLTDFCCWVPIGVLSILVQAGAVEVNARAYAWIATFVLPINSALNPFLYTLGDVISDKKFTCKHCKHGNINQVMPLEAPND